MKTIILASSSQRRKNLLRQLGLNFKAVAPNAKEDVGAALSPRKFVEKTALRKALSVASKTKSGIVIGADTIFVCKGTKLGKPNGETEAFRMLRFMSSRKVNVYSGVAIIDSKTGKKAVDSEKTTLTVRRLADEEIRAYIRTKEPLGKAGAIAIQGLGAKFVSRIDGSASNVIGLPLECLLKNLREFGISASITR
jgi:septum formation protein